VKYKLHTELRNQKSEQNTVDADSAINPKSDIDETIRPPLRMAKLGNLLRHKSQIKTETAINEDRGD
jgi:hypothetical protein